MSFVDKQLNYGRKQIVELSTGYSPAVILDIGAGSGKDLDALKKTHPHARTVGIECLPSNADILRSKGHEVYSADLEKERLPFEDGTVDLIIANQILEHCKEIFWILHEITRVLKPGGYCILGVPNLASLHNRFLLMIGRQPTSIQLYSAHIRGFTYPGLIKFLENIYPSGYEIHGFKGANFYPFPSGSAQLLAKVFPKLSVGIFFKLKKVKPYNKEFILYPQHERLETNYYLGGKE